MKLAQVVVGCAGAITALSLFAAEARAGADEKIAAEALFDEGRRLMVEGKFAVACTKLEESERMDAAVGTLLYLAECYEKTGRTASAWATFREASSAARAGGQLERARVGQERAARLEPLLVRLTINVAADDAQIPGFTLKRSTEVVPQALWGSAVPVDPGDYTVEASAPGYEPFSRRVTIGKESMSTEVPRLVQSAASTAPTAPVNGAGPVEPVVTTPAPSPVPPPAANQGSGLSGMKIAGIVVAGAGVVSLAVGTVFGVNAISKNDDAKKAGCSGSVCHDPKGVTLTNDADSAATVANVTVGLGLAALVGGGLLYFLSPSASSGAEQHASFHVIPVVGPQGVGAFAEGRF
jgi:hypothetical protein